MNKENIQIAITAGHGGADPGAVAFGRKEADCAVQLRTALTLKLKQLGYTVLNDARGKHNPNLPLRQAIELAKQADVACELHFNASSKASVRGVEVLAHEDDKELAQAIAQGISSITHTPIRGDKGWRPENAGQHSRLGFVRAGGLIIETEFLTCAEAMETYESVLWLVAGEIATAIDKYIKTILKDV